MFWGSDTMYVNKPLLKCTEFTSPKSLASEASEKLSGVYKLELMRYIYMYRGTCAIIVVHATHT